MASIAFVLGFATLSGMLIIGAMIPRFARGDLDTDFLGQNENLFVKISAIFAFILALFVYRCVRAQVSRTVVFHACFLSGIALLGYALWATLALYPILNQSFLGDWSGKTVQPAFTGPVLCFFIIPAGVLLLGFATVHDNQR